MPTCCGGGEEPGGGRKTPVPGTGSLGAESLGGTACHAADDAGGSGTGAGKGIADATGAVRNSGCMPLEGGRCWECMGGPDKTPVVETTP